MHLTVKVSMLFGLKNQNNITLNYLISLFLVTTKTWCYDWPVNSLISHANKLAAITTFAVFFK